MKKAVTLQCL